MPYRSVINITLYILIILKSKAIQRLLSCVYYFAQKASVYYSVHWYDQDKRKIKFQKTIQTEYEYHDLLLVSTTVPLVKLLLSLHNLQFHRP